MSDIVIQAEHISKDYRLGTIGTGTLSRDLNMWWAKLRGKSNPYAKVGDTGSFDVSTHQALNDVSFEINRGEAVGIIGKNGAGKSTLLKILSRVTTPSSGCIRVKGRIASLLEVGTGFHPELTGRENIFLNGAILGMSKAEVRKKFDEIVDFAGIEKFVDTPVKRYSSGMYVRLAFAVAAHLEPEILIVDEVLAVGDAEFQNKCIGKMQDVSKNEGRTVLFVSHNLGAVNQLCTKGVLLNRGKVEIVSTIDSVVAQYMRGGNKVSSVKTSSFSGNLSQYVFFEKIYINQVDADLNHLIVSPLIPLHIRVAGETRSDISIRCGLSIFRDGVRLFTVHDVDTPEKVLIGSFESHYTIPAYFLRPGHYSIALGAYEGSDKGEWTWGTELVTFEVLEEWSSSYEQRSFGLINIKDIGKRIIRANTYLN